MSIACDADVISPALVTRSWGNILGYTMWRVTIRRIRRRACLIQKVTAEKRNIKVPYPFSARNDFFLLLTLIGTALLSQHPLLITPVPGLLLQWDQAPDTLVVLCQSVRELETWNFQRSWAVTQPREWNTKLASWTGDKEPRSDERRTPFKSWCTKELCYVHLTDFCHDLHWAPSSF